MSPAASLRIRLSVTAVATALATSSPAHAQSGGERFLAVQNDGLEEVVVLATKRATNLQDTAIAMSVMNAEALEDRHVKALYDLADGSIPGLRVATFEARRSALTVGVRGIVPLDANQPAREQGVGIYIDGV